MTTPVDTTNPIEQFSPFLPTTFNIPEEGDRLNSFIEENFASFTDIINSKKIGTVIDQVSVFNGELWSYTDPTVFRNGYTAMAYIESYPNTGTLTLTLPSTPASAGSVQNYPIPDVNDTFVITELYGTASKPPSDTGAGDGNFFAFMCEGDARISFTMTDTVIVITTTGDYTEYSGFIFISYLRNGL